MTRSKANPANPSPRTAQAAAKHPARAGRGTSANEAVAAREAVATAEMGTTEDPECAADAAERADDAATRTTGANAQADQPAQSAADDAADVTEVGAAATPARAATPEPAEAPTPTAAAAPPPTSPSAPAPATKLARLIALLRQPDGATIEAMGKATGWQAHSVRGAMAGALRRKGLVVVSERPDSGPRRYRIGDDA